MVVKKSLIGKLGIGQAKQVISGLLTLTVVGD